MTFVRYRPGRALAVLLIMAASVSGLYAGTNVWTNAAGGDFMDPNNWDPPAVPGSNDVAVFNLTSAPYRVYWSDSVTNFGYQVPRGSLTWDFQGNTYAYSNRYYWDFGTDTSAAELVIMNGVGTGLGATSAGAMPRILGSGTVVTAVSNVEFHLQEHRIGAGACLLVDGSNSIFGYGQCRNMAGTIIVTNGGYYNCGGQFYAMTGSTVRISGENSRMTSQTTGLRCGQNGGIYISEGGFWSIAANSDTAIWTNTHIVLDNGVLRSSRRIINLEGILEGRGVVTANFFNVSGWVRPGGSNGVGLLRNVGNLYNYETNTAISGFVEIELGGTTTNEYDRLSVSSTFYAGGMCAVSLINGFQPRHGARFDILDFTSLSNVFDSLVLPGGVLHWDLSKLYTDGEIRYLNPGTIVSFR